MEGDMEELLEIDDVINDITDVIEKKGRVDIVYAGVYYTEAGYVETIKVSNDEKTLYEKNLKNVIAGDFNFTNDIQDKLLEYYLDELEDNAVHYFEEYFKEEVKDYSLYWGDDALYVIIDTENNKYKVVVATWSKKNYYSHQVEHLRLIFDFEAEDFEECELDEWDV